MKGEWLGQQPLGQPTQLQSTPRQSAPRPAACLIAAAFWCLLLACGGCVDIAARTAGLPISGELPSEEAATASVEGDDAAEIATAGPGRPSFEMPATDSPSAETSSSEASLPESSATSDATGSGAYDPASSVDGFPDADEVGLESQRRGD